MITEIIDVVKYALKSKEVGVIKATRLLGGVGVVYVAGEVISNISKYLGKKSKKLF